MKQIIVNVSGLSAEEKQRVNEALAKITGFNRATSSLVAAKWLYAPSSYNNNHITHSDEDISHKNKETTHTPRQVLEMAGMEASTDQHVFLADKLVITDSSGRIVYDGTLQSISSFIKSRVSAGKDGPLPSSDFWVKTDENGVAVMETSQGHVHAHLMALYAEDAKTTDKPWELWQIKDRSGIWWECIDNPVWGRDTEYRRKPKTKLIHGVEVPDISFTPKDGEEFVYPNIYDENYATVGRFYSCYELSEMALKAGCCYPYTEEGTQAAILHAKIMLGDQS